MINKELEKALQDMALTTNWGSVERVGADFVPKNVAVIRETIDYINRLEAENERIRKETAKEILDDFDKKSPFGCFSLQFWEDRIKEEYGVEVEE